MVLAAHLCLLAPLTGCESGKDDKPTLPADLVRVVDEADGSPVAGIKVVVMDPDFNMPVAGPFISGPDGLVNMGMLPRTDLALMVFCGVGYRVHSLPGYGTWNPNSSGGGLTNPDAPMDIQVRRATMDSLPRIAGRVVDSQTGVPLKQVFVSLSPYLTGYQGDTGPADDATGDDGKFSVSQIPFAQDPQSGNLIQISPLRFSCRGYRPVVWKYDSPNGSENVDIRGVTIEMELIGLDNHWGIITGVLMRDGIPAAGIVVGLGVVDQSPGNKVGPGLPGWVEVSDEFGRFLFNQLPLGTYILQPGFALGDEVYYPPQPGNPPLVIKDRQVVNAGTLNILHEIEPVGPPHGATLPQPPPTLSWTAVPAAVTYEVRFDRGILPPTNTNSIDLPGASAGTHYWSVRAFNKAGNLIGISQIQSIFRILPPPD